MEEKFEQLKWDIVCTGNEVMISDTTIKIQEIYGGFGQGQKVLTIPQIALLHVDNPNDKEEVKKRIKRINELINDNIILESGDKYFEFGIDIIDLKRDGRNDLFTNLKRAGVYTQAQIGNATNLYILSEQGYSLLINLMKDTRSKVIYKKVIRDYFKLKEYILSKEDTEQYMLRLLGKKERKRTTDTIKYFIDNGFIEHDPKDPRRNAYARETNYIYRLLFGMTAKEIEAFLGLELKPYDTVRNYLSAKDIDDIMRIEGRVAYMQEDDKNYKQIQNRLKELYSRPRRPQMADKSISLIKRLSATE
jgi:hypothetical protein